MKSLNVKGRSLFAYFWQLTWNMGWCSLMLFDVFYMREISVSISSFRIRRDRGTVHSDLGRTAFSRFISVVWLRVPDWNIEIYAATRSLDHRISLFGRVRRHCWSGVSHSGWWWYFAIRLFGSSCFVPVRSLRADQSLVRIPMSRTNLPHTFKNMRASTLGRRARGTNCDSPSSYVAPLAVRVK